jgi:uncharacterized membrane protein YhaH (DUF805 family)
MQKNTKPYWFPAKRYGWGWGLPSAWQGWVVFIIFIGVVSILPAIVRPDDNMPLFLLAMTSAVAVLIAICYAKGEPPKWRWGNSGNDKK